MELRLFFLDDDLIQNDIMKEYLSLIDIPLSSSFFIDGVQMIEHIKTLEKHKLPHALFIDVFMPRINGWEVIRSLEQHMQLMQWFPSIYVATSSISHKDKEEAKRQRYLKAVINKPIGLAKLKPLLQHEFDTHISN